MSAPYKSTAVFDAETLPLGLRKVHSTKEGTWGVIRMLEGGCASPSLTAEWKWC